MSMAEEMQTIIGIKTGFDSINAVVSTNVNVTGISVQLFEKLKLQESAAGDEPAKKDEGQEQASKRQPVKPGTTQTSLSSQPADSRGQRGHAEPASSDAEDKHKAPAEAQGSQGRQRRQPQPYGKVHTRHIKQLFIRGESVVLVNPQPL